MAITTEESAIRCCTADCFSELPTIQNIVSSAGLDQAWWTGITIAAMLCLFLVIQSVVLANKKDQFSRRIGYRMDAAVLS